MLPLLLMLLAAAEKPAAGEVKLPLRDYLLLLDKIEAAAKARAEAQQREEPAVAEVATQRVSVTWNEADADVQSVYEVEVRGRQPQPVALPLTGLAFKVVVEPAGSAAVARAEGGLSLLAPAAGRYRVTASSKAVLTASGGADSLVLAPMTAPVAEAELSLPADRQWRCAGAVVAEDSPREGRRLVRIAVPRGKPAAFEVRRLVKAGEAEKALARAVVVTLLDLAADGPRRHDVVLYEVARGELSSLLVTLPEGVEPERLATDEGEVPPLAQGREVRVERTHKLTGTGYLAVTWRPTAGDRLPLAAVVPRVPVRARYLALASSVAADAFPVPADTWARADIGDLPQPVREAAAVLDLASAWRQRREDAAPALDVKAAPPAALLETVVCERDSLTLLTVEGTLLHRDRFTLSGGATDAFELTLPVSGSLWSVQVGGMAVRPLEQAGRVRIPLGLAARDGAVIETVVVQSQAVPPGRSRLEVALPELAVPVLEHRWRLLLPEGNRYRLARSDLDPPRQAPAEPRPKRKESAAARLDSVALGPGGSAGLRGKVLDESGSALPGASVHLRSPALAKDLTVHSGPDGSFYFPALAAGSYVVVCERTGFRTGHFEIDVRSGETRAYALTLSVAAVEETVTVTGPPPLLSSVEGRDKGDYKRSEEAQRAAAFREQAAQLRQGLVGGVRPVPVAIPETGKVLVLAGALPPARVTAELEVKARP